MKTLTTEDLASLSSRVSTWAFCVMVTDANGVISRYTDHDTKVAVSRTSNPFAINGDYLPILSASTSAVSGAADLSVDNLSAQVALESIGITASDIRAGLYDDVQITLIMVNWLNPTNSGIILTRGLVGTMKTQGDGSAGLEFRGLKQYLQQTIIETYSLTCRADLGDARCKVDLAPLTGTGTITSIVANRLSLVASGISGAGGDWTGGRITFTSGANTGYGREVKSDDGLGGIAVFEPYPGDFQVGDTFSITPGCNKLHVVTDGVFVTGDCKGKFNNLPNMRAEPMIPGPSAVLAPPP